MKLKPEQIARLRKPFDKYGAFEGVSDEEIEKTLNGVMDYYLTLARINVRLKKEEKNNGNKEYGKNE